MSIEIKDKIFENLRKVDYVEQSNYGVIDAIDDAFNQLKVIDSQRQKIDQLEREVKHLEDFFTRTELNVCKENQQLKKENKELKECLNTHHETRLGLNGTGLPYGEKLKNRTNHLLKTEQIKERDKATKDLFKLIHDTVNSTLSLKAGFENIQYRYKDDEYLMDSMERQIKKVERIDKAIDKYYLDVKGEPRK